jgi:Flp pilus assembly protein TadG
MMRFSETRPFSFSQFKASQSGGVAIIFAFTIIPAALIIGASIDYSRASNSKQALQKAADAAALAVIKDTSANWNERQKVGKRVFAEQMESQNIFSNPIIVIKRTTKGVQVTAEANVRQAILRRLNPTLLKPKVVSEIVSGGRAKNIEIALVLDTTVSMTTDMPRVKTAATDFVNAVSGGGGAKISIVPFVASVNVGPSNLPMSMMDEYARSYWHGRTLRGKRSRYVEGCVGTPVTDYDDDGGGNGNSGGGGGGSNGRGGDQGFNKFHAIKNNFAGFVQELLGIKPSLAQAIVTPNTVDPIMNYTMERQNGSVEFMMPEGFTRDECQIFNPSTVSHFDLFRRVIGPNGLPVRWKGCVIARTKPFDTNDVEPTQNDPETLFVPYFWDTEHDNYDNRKHQYLPLGRKLPGWMDEYETGVNHRGSWMYSILRYDGKTIADIDDTPPYTSGPNRACGDELMPLSSNMQDVKAKIQSLNTWEGGGTITSEGIMWGWRALSPENPLPQGSAYGTVDKYMIVMTDGINTLNPKRQTGSYKSDYSAYGAVAPSERLGRSISSYESGLDELTLKACTNAKAAGVKIIGLHFDPAPGPYSQLGYDLLRTCIGDEKLMFKASTSAQIGTAFNDIAHFLESDGLKYVK